MILTFPPSHTSLKASLQNGCGPPDQTSDHMMAAFTRASTTSGTSQTGPIPIGSPTTPTSVPNEDDVCTATCPTPCSLEKHCAPSTPTLNATLLQQRFLRET